MAVIVVRPYIPEEAVGGTELHRLQIFVELEDFEGVYDLLEIWGASDSAGPYAEKTAAQWLPPRLPLSALNEPASPVTGRLIAITGKQLKVKPMDSSDFVITVNFTGGDPLTYAQAAGQVTAQGLGQIRGYVDPNGLFVLQSTLPGAQSRIRVLESDGAAILGLPVDVPAEGREARIPLIPGRTTYSFVDPYASSPAFYKTRLRNRSTQIVSPFSEIFGVTPVKPGVSLDNSIIGQINLVGIDGKPVTNAEVTVHGTGPYMQVEGKLVAWGPLKAKTNNHGHVEFVLVRGVKATAVINGTSIVRDFVVPTDPSITLFNILGVEASSTDDNFKVVVPEITSAERRTT